MNFEAFSKLHSWWLRKVLEENFSGVKKIVFFWTSKELFKDFDKVFVGIRRKNCSSDAQTAFIVAKERFYAKPNKIKKLWDFVRFEQNIVKLQWKTFPQVCVNSILCAWRKVLKENTSEVFEKLKIFRISRKFFRTPSKKKSDFEQNNWQLCRNLLRFQVFSLKSFSKRLS